MRNKRFLGCLTKEWRGTKETERELRAGRLVDEEFQEVLSDEGEEKELKEACGNIYLEDSN